MGLEISKRYSYIFIKMSLKLYEDIGYHGGIQAVTFSWQSAKFKKKKNFKHGSQWENLEMCNILKMAERRAKWMKIWDLCP